MSATPQPAILGQYRNSLMFRWDTGTLAWVVWDGSLTTGALTIGTVNQGTGGASNWAVKQALIAGAPLNGQAKIAVTATAVQLGSNALTNGVILTAKSTNAAAITVGASGVTNTADGTGNGYILEQGSSAPWAVDNTNRLFINGTAGDIVSWSGS